MGQVQHKIVAFVAKFSEFRVSENKIEVFRNAI